LRRTVGSQRERGQAGTNRRLRLCWSFSHLGCTAKGESLRPAARVLVGAGEVITRDQRVGVVGAEHPPLRGEGSLIEGDRLTLLFSDELGLDADGDGECGS
jgi:hypothetical protein